MSEYQFVERPLLTQLDSMGWTVIDQAAGIPKDPAKSLRSNFREYFLRDVFINAVRDINRTDNGDTWLMDAGGKRIKAVWKLVKAGSGIGVMPDDVSDAEPLVQQVLP